MRDEIQCSTCEHHAVYWNLTTSLITCDQYPEGIPASVEGGSGECSCFVSRKHGQIDPETHQYKEYRRSPKDDADEFSKCKDRELPPQGIVAEALIEAQKQLMGIEDDEGR